MSTNEQTDFLDGTLKYGDIEGYRTGDPSVIRLLYRAEGQEILLNMYEARALKMWLEMVLPKVNGEPASAHETSERRERGWLVEDGGGNARPRYRTMDQMGIHWTEDANQAIRFARRADAEMFAAGDDDAWRIVEHEWVSIDGEPHRAEKATAFSGTPSSGMGCIVCGRLFFQGRPTCNCNGPQLSQNGSED